MSALRRLPLREAVASLSQGSGSTRLSSAVAAVTLRFVARNSESGPREFLRTIAPRIAYANPSLPFLVSRIPDPRSKALNPESPDAGAKPWEDGQPGPSFSIDFHGKPTQTVPLRHLSAEQIWQQLLSVAGEDVPNAIEPPAESGASAQAEADKAS